MEEKEGLLQVEHTDEDASEHASRPILRGRTCLSIYLIVLHFALALAVWKAVESKRFGVSHNEDAVYSPARSAVKYEMNNDHSTSHSYASQFMKKPDDANDTVWRTLVNPTYFAVTDDEMSAANMSTEDSIKLEQGGHLGALAVYHQLHCLRQLRHFVYKDVFLPNYDEKGLDSYMKGHLDHCIDALRSLVMCKGDVSLYTFTWAQEYPHANKSILSRVNAPRECVNWESIEEWSISRAVSWRPKLIDPNGDIVTGNGGAS